MNYIQKLIKYKQEHLLNFENELSNQEKENLHKQIESLDFSYLDELNKKENKTAPTITPIKAITIDEITENKEQFEKIGLDVLKNQKVGILLLAGGMGTRLGFDKPKGMFNIGKTKTIYIFQKLIENTLNVVKKCGKPIPFFIMTSEKNNDETIAFLEEHNYFGYDKNYVCFFVQDTAPCVDLNGKILLENKGKIATSPNGNGGWFNSLLNNEKSKTMFESLNLEWLNIIGVDNILQNIADPIFIGATVGGNYQIGSKVTRKTGPYEKVGVMCHKNNHPAVVEYIDLPEYMALQTDNNGQRVYDFGIVLNYLFNVDLLYKIKDEKLPIHVVTKKVEHIDNFGNLIKPETPNAHKFEMLCADMIEFADTCLPFEVARQKEFAPIKNKEGVDSVATAQALLEQNGYEL